MVAGRGRRTPMNFAEMRQSDVPQGRNGKHKAIVTRILSDLDQMDPGQAIRVPLVDLAESKEKVRSAVNRASRKAGRTVSTASDDIYLYLWNEPAPDVPAKSAARRT
jgi:hypothetical protein